MRFKSETQKKNTVLWDIFKEHYIIPSLGIFVGIHSNYLTYSICCSCLAIAVEKM